MSRVENDFAADKTSSFKQVCVTYDRTFGPDVFQNWEEKASTKSLRVAFSFRTGNAFFPSSGRCKFMLSWLPGCIVSKTSTRVGNIPNMACRQHSKRARPVCFRICCTQERNHHGTHRPSPPTVLEIINLVERKWHDSRTSKMFNAVFLKEISFFGLSRSTTENYWAPCRNKIYNCNVLA